MATREIYWNISGSWLLYPMLLIAMLFFTFGFYRRYQLWRLGQPENRWGHVFTRIKDVFRYGFGHQRIIKNRFPGVMHLLIFWGFLLLLFATICIMLQAYLGIPLFQGALYLFIKVSANIAGLAVLVGISMAAWRRYVVRPTNLTHKKDDSISLALIFLIIVTGFMIQGVRMAVIHDPWGAYAFVGYAMVPLLQKLFSEPTLLSIHIFSWWLHLVLMMLFIAYLPYSKLSHIFLAPANQFLRKHGPIGVPEKIDFENENLTTLGKSQWQEFSWKSFFDTDACVRCGRCQDHCPANLSGKHLNPQQMIQNLRKHMGELKPKGEKESVPNLIGQTISEQDIWACTTCRSCEQHCPIFIEHVDKLIELRRHLVLTEARFPTEAQPVFRNLENNGNPWGVGWDSRANHLIGLDAPVLSDNPNPEILYWSGCSGAFDKRNQKTSTAFVQLLQKAGVNFSIIGQEEKCCGDPARRLGNEYLFHSLALENIETMNALNVKKIVTSCPHCFHVLKEEYPEFGGEYEVLHHTQYLNELIHSNRLKVSPTTVGKTVTYHDSCYLGRYHQIYDAPRQLLKSVGLSLCEMPNHNESSFCCGAGGGKMWLEENEGSYINEIRAEEALSLNTDFISTACPFCLTMIMDGVLAKDTEKEVAILDVAEILNQVLEKPSRS